MVGLGISVDDKLYEEFSKVVSDFGYTKYRAIEAALRVFLALPPEVQVRLMNDNVDAYALLVDTFRKNALTDELKNLSDEQKNQVLIVAREISKQLSRKKG